LNVPPIDSLLDNFLQEMSGKYPYDWIGRISGYHRMKVSSEFEAILLRIQEELLRIGYSKDDVSHEKFPADGTKKAWEWERTMQWEVIHAECWIEHPITKKICSYEDLPISLVTYSQSANLTAELIDIGKGEEEKISSLDLQGKIVLLCNSAYEKHKSYEKYGAVGVIVYPDLPRAKVDSDMVLYDTIMGTKEEISQSGFGFSISFGQAQELKQLLASGGVKIRVDIETQLFNGNFHSLSAVIPGKKEPKKQIIVMGHLCHPNPGANDNASGSALTLEIARSLKRMLDQKKIESPDYSIRFLWAAEYMGTIIWQKAHEAELKNCVAMINLDMVGLSLLKSGYPIEIIVESVTTPSWFQILLPYLADRVSKSSFSTDAHGNNHPFAYKITYFDGGSDHTVFSDPFFGIPTAMFGGDDPYYHSSIDTIDKIDSTRLKRVGALALFMAYFYGKPDIIAMDALKPLIISHIHTTFTKTSRLIYTEFECENRTHYDQGVLLLNLTSNFLNRMLHNLQKVIPAEKSHSNYQFLDGLIEKRFQLELTQWDMYNHLEEIGKENNIVDNKSPPSQKFRMDIFGPFPNALLYPLFEKQQIKQLMEDTNAPFGGSILEILFMLRQTYSIMDIWGYLSLEYGKILKINQIEELIQIFINHKIPLIPIDE